MIIIFLSLKAVSLKKLSGNQQLSHPTSLSVASSCPKAPKGMEGDLSCQDAAEQAAAPPPPDYAAVCISRAHLPFPSSTSGPNALSSQEQGLLLVGTGAGQSIWGTPVGACQGKHTRKMLLLRMPGGSPQSCFSRPTTSALLFPCLPASRIKCLGVASFLLVVITLQVSSGLLALRSKT